MGLEGSLMAGVCHSEHIVQRQLDSPFRWWPGGIEVNRVKDELHRSLLCLPGPISQWADSGKMQLSRKRTKMFRLEQLMT
jgi:hypothetical protein